MQPDRAAVNAAGSRDVDRAKTFYEAVLQIRLQRLAAPEEADGGDLTMWAFPMSEEQYGASGALVRMDGITPGTGGTMVYFSCEDCTVEAARAADPKDGVGD